MGATAAKTTNGRTGQPRLVIANRPTVFSKGHQGSITLWGRRDWASAPFRRQRFRCEPADGSDPHTFSLGRRRPTEHRAAGEECLTCDIKPGVAQGPISSADYFHTATEIAHLIQLVAQGMSLRRASRTIRLEAHRYWEDAHGMRHASRQHTLAARYLDLFGTAIDKALAPTRCPRILILDSKPLNLRAYGADEFDKFWNRDERGGAVLIAVGGDDPGKRLLPWRIGLAPDETGRSWIDFLDEIDPGGDGPEWVVADGAGAIANAVARRADGKNSLAALHPHLVREWDATANGPLRPDRIKATYDKAVRWICLDDPEHKSYKMSPFTRARTAIGCSLARRRAKAQAARAA